MRNFILGLFTCISFTSCVSIIAGTKRPLAVVDAPSDLKVKNLTTGKDLKVEQVRVTGAGGVVQFCSGIKFKVKKGTQLQFTSGNQTGTLTIGTKPYVGVLILEGILTLGIGTIIDISTGATKTPKPEFVDIPAILNGTSQRTVEALKSYVLSNSKVTRY